MKNKFLLLLAALFLSATVSFGATNTTSTAKAIVKHALRETDMTQEVKDYLASFNINAVSVSMDPRTGNYYAFDAIGHEYVVYVSEGIIRGWDEVDL